VGNALNTMVKINMEMIQRKIDAGLKKPE